MVSIFFFQSGVEENIFPGQSELMIKEECGFAIKQENDNDRALYSTHYVEQSTSACCTKCFDTNLQMKQIVEERDKLNADLINAKNECHEMSVERTNAERFAVKMDIDKKKLKGQINDVSAVVEDLKKRNAALISKMSSINTESEVENLVGHKMQKGVEMYLVKWKNTWLPVDNLNCDSKLRKYQQKNKMTATTI